MRESRSKALGEIFDIFKELMDFEDVEVKDEDATVKAVKENIRQILKIEELVRMRSNLIKISNEGIID